ncbi:hypothetical protein [Streptomyces sp. NPDC088554]|uniref:hypothetical protein n=1 Tax=Streptomyces sp. NPDC088554 TaxID=3365865 RepID=UPI00381221F5
MTPSEAYDTGTAATSTGTGVAVAPVTSVAPPAPGAPAAAVLCAVAACGDLVAFQQLLARGPAVALPFLVAAVALLGVARWLWASRRTAVTLTAIAVLTALTCLYVVAAGVAPTAGQDAEVLRAGLVRTVVLVAQLVALPLLLRTLSGPVRSWAVNGVLGIGVALWALRLTGPLG